jgi:hypothetical protein
MDGPERTGMRGFEARERDGKKRTGRGSSNEKRGVPPGLRKDGRKWVWVSGLNLPKSPLGGLPA